MSLDHKVTYRENASSFIPHSKSSSSPSFSTGSSESYALSRCSSVSSLASSYSAITTTSVLSTDDESDDQICLVSILKKPKGSPYSHSRQRNHGRNSSDTGDENRLVDNTDDDDGNEADDANDDLDEWEDDEGECDIIFERNVTFDEPLATDIITGAQVLPSSRSRLEWAAVKARECLERERAVLEGAWSSSREGEIETGVDAVPKDISSEIAGPRWQDKGELEAEEIEGEDEREEEHISKLLPKLGLLDSDRHMSKGMNCGEEGEVKRRCDAEAEDLVYEITETVIRQVGQQQQQQQQQLERQEAWARQHSP